MKKVNKDLPVWSSSMNAFVLLLVGLMAFSMPVYSQAEGEIPVDRDFELWTGAQLRFKPKKKWTIGLDYEYRFKENASVVDKSYTELSLKRKIYRGLSLALGGRYVWFNDTEGGQQGIRNRFRWNADLGYNATIKRFDIISRLRYQSRTNLYNENPSVDVIRLKLGTAYNIKNWKLDPEFSFEGFSRLGEEETLTKIRITFGTSYDLKDYGELTVFYRYEEGFREDSEQIIDIAGIRYKYSFKLKKKKKDF